MNTTGKRSKGLSAGALFLMVLVLTACPHTHLPPVEPFSYLIDPSIQPNQPTILGPGGERPVVALQDDQGRQYDFIGNEVVIVPASQSQLDQFLARRAGVVVADRQEDGAERTVVVRLDPTGFPLDRLVDDAEIARIPGEHRFSSEAAARLMALVLRERAGGLKVASDGLHLPHQAVMLTAVDANSRDAIPQAHFDGPVSGGNVSQAWQYLAGLRLSGPLPRVPVAIIDGGFQVDALGGSIPDASGNSDFPAQPLQWDFVNDSPVITGSNVGNCTGGAACPWHGHGAASVATATLGNGAYAAGTGGMVADAILLNTDYSTSQVKAALDRARGLGARVINMSFGGSCGTWCSLDRDIAGYYNAFERAINADILLIASAGNNNKNVVSEDIQPCTIDGVLCVGALGSEDEDGFHVWDNRRWSGSNHGSGVDIYAPSTIWAWYGHGLTPDLGWFSATSSAAPFVAGVAAMVRSANPGLNRGDVFNLLLSTARTDSPDVPRYLDAYAAVRSATNSQLPSDRFEPNNSAGQAIPLIPDVLNSLTIGTVNDTDYFRTVITAPTVVEVALTYPTRIGRMGLPPYGRETTQTCGYVEQLGMTRSADSLVASFRVPGGNFVFSTTSPGAPLPYNMGLSTTSVSIAPDAYEPNDSLATSRNVGDGGYLAATLHNASDEDYYTVYSQGSFSTMVLSLYSRVIVESSDVPLTVRVYDNANNLIGTAQADANCSQPIALDLPQGFNKVRVSGPGPGAYRLFLGSYAEQHPLIDLETIFYLLMHPNVPIEIVVREPEQWYVINSISDLPLDGLRLDGGGLHLTLFDQAGEQLLGEGVPQAQGEGEILTVNGLVDDNHYLLRVSRTAEVLVGGELPLIPAVLTSLQ